MGARVATGFLFLYAIGSLLFIRKLGGVKIRRDFPLILRYNSFEVRAVESNLEKATSILQKLSVENLKMAISLLELLALKEELEATEEVRGDEEINRQLAKAREARARGKYDEFVPWELRHGV